MVKAGWEKIRCQIQELKICFKKSSNDYLPAKPGKMAQRMCLSEHHFGTLKRAQGSYYFLLRGNQKTQGEFALFSLGYNIQRMINSLEFENMINQIEAMAHFGIISIFFEPRSIQLEIYY